MTTNPVTQTAEVEVKRASIKEREPFVVENGAKKSRAPMRIAPKKLRIKILGGVRCLDMKSFICKVIFIDIEGVQRESPRFGLNFN